MAAYPCQAMFCQHWNQCFCALFDDSKKSDKVVLIDASKLGEEYKDSNGLKKVRLRDEEIDKIVNTFQNKEAVDDFSVTVTYDEIKEKDIVFLLDSTSTSR